MNSDIALTEARLCLPGAGSGTISAHEVNESFDVDALTYNNRPTYKSQYIDHFSFKENSDDIILAHFDITDLLAEWLTGAKENNGLAVTSGTPEENGFAILYSMENKTSSPTMLIDFIDTNGYDSTFDYHNQSAGRAGNIYINDFTRKLFVDRNDLAISGNIMPVDIGFMYGGSMNLLDDLVKTDYVYGKNWMSNYNRMLIPSFGGEDHAAYITESGNMVNFVKGTSSEGKETYVDEKKDILGYRGFELEEINTGLDFDKYNPENYRIKSISGEIETFDSYGRLVKIQNEEKEEQQIRIFYVANDSSQSSKFLAIDYLLDGVGRKYDFTYSQNTGLLESIQCFNANGAAIMAGSTESTPLKVTYAYDAAGNLTQVTFPDSKSIKYSYDNNGNILDIINVDDYKLTYEYDNAGKLTSSKEFAKELLKGYIAGNCVSITPEGSRRTKFVDGTGATEIKEFDRYGRTFCILDENGNYLMTPKQYLEDENSETRTNLFEMNSWECPSTNMLENSGFEFCQPDTNEYPCWDISSSNNGSATLSDYEKFQGSYAVELSAKSGGYQYLTQEVYIAEPGDYTFSAYVKPSSENIENGMIMKIAYNNGNCAERASITECEDAWERYSVTANIPSGVSYVTVSLIIIGEGSFLIDALQLEKAQASAITII